VPQPFARLSSTLSRLDLSADDFTDLWLARFDLPVRVQDRPDNHYLILDPALTILVADDDYLRATRLTPAEVLGRPFFGVYPDSPANPDQTATRLRAVLARLLSGGPTGEMSRHRYDLRLPDGTFTARWWRVHNFPLADAGGRVRGVLHTARPDPAPFHAASGHE